MDEQSRLRKWRYRVTERGGEISWDLLGAVAFAVVAAVSLSMLGSRESAIAPLLGIPLLVFLPGYVVVAAVFPRRQRSETAGTLRPAGISLAERAALSFAVSLAVLPPLAVVWWAVGPGLDHIPVGLAAFICLGSVLAFVRRSRLPSTDRFRLPVGRWTVQLRGAVAEGPRVGRSVNALLLLSVLLATVSLGVALAVPNGGGAYSSLYLGTETGSGDLVASGYPSELERGESAPLTVGVTNNEGTRTSYTVVAELQRVDRTGETLSVQEARELDRFRFTLDASETRELRHSITPRMSGEDLRVQYALYRGPAGETPNPDEAYRTVHFWVTVSERGR